ncbi:hypothetical protein D9758_010392 [Tetrapyrgos nigripes]|uniref:Peptidase M20 dimerisation domain-containing protein n=1 Tax=Tetrapyrgos nigripes TaxID=182062 RepID=A0A8H5FW03_9AGAR|nr:hypothetical protein D9758_010392 [Tetrapyrgos nigripes]
MKGLGEYLEEGPQTTHSPDVGTTVRNRGVLKKLLVIPVILASAFLLHHSVDTSTFRPFRHVGDDDLCVQASPLFPDLHDNLWTELQRDLEAKEFKEKVVEWLSGAIQVPTEMFDDMGPVDQDPRWKNRKLFHEYLVQAFPLIHSNQHITLQKVNTYGLLYTWEGSEAALKPIVMAAHQDVVPVNSETIDEWTYPPYSGHFDGERIWGRGANDDKSGLIGIFTAVETLLSRSFVPARTIIFPFGFDEEGGGFQGAKELGKVLVDIYGEDSFAFVIDEGGGFAEQFGRQFATPGIAEKGSLTVQLNIATPGGHSSVPPDHTSIGILSRLLVEFENNPFDVALSRSSPLYAQLQCFAQHASTLSPALKNTIKRSISSDKALEELEKEVFKTRLWKAMSGTTQAIDVIHGGVKSNALPEQASSSDVETHDTRILTPLAESFNLTFSAFGKLVSEGGPSSGKLDLESLSTRQPLEPAPVTPLDSTAFQLLSGTIRSTFATHRGLFHGDSEDDEEKSVVVAPGMPTGNTDTRFYWKLSRNIFRYKHHHSESSAHTVNEFIEVDSYLEMIRFYLTLILNTDEARDI